jgi:predicted amidohydrolase YtcJ
MAGQLFLYNGRIFTGDNKKPWVSAILIEDQYISAIGESHEFSPSISRDSISINLEGSTVLPGFCDSHIHVADWAKKITQIQLGGCSGYKEVLDRIKNGDSEQEWVLGWGWNANEWDEYVMPLAKDLNFLHDHSKAIFINKDYHTAWVNYAVFDLMDTGKLLKNIQNGRIPLDESGKPSGIVKEDALNELITPIIKEMESPVFQEPEKIFNELFKQGITSVHAIEDYNTFLKFQDLYQDPSKRGPRFRSYIYWDDHDMLEKMFMTSGGRGSWFEFLGVKIFLDGSLGSRSAAMRFDYTDKTAQSFLKYTNEELEPILSKASRRNWDMMVHVIGDAALEQIFDLINTYPNTYRLEHVQYIPEDLLERTCWRDLSVCINPSHLPGDIPLAEKIWGKEKCAYAYNYRDLWKTGANILIGSDAPVESVNPWKAIHAALYRYPEKVQKSWNVDQSLTLDECIEAFTVNPSKSIGKENLTGKLIPGMLADLIVLNEDPFETDDFLNIQTIMTIIDGRIVYSVM